MIAARTRPIMTRGEGRAGFLPVVPPVPTIRASARTPHLPGAHGNRDTSRGSTSLTLPGVFGRPALSLWEGCR